jgi:hypothetical protein
MTGTDPILNPCPGCNAEPGEPCRPACLSWTDRTEFDLNDLARRVSSLGVPSSVEHSGGDVATLYAGYSGYPEVIAGPGWFTGPGWTNARASWDEFSYGIDDDKETEHVTDISPRTLDAVARAIAELARSLEATT